jgi:hypothetical protein
MGCAGRGWAAGEVAWKARLAVASSSGARPAGARSGLVAMQRAVKGGQQDKTLLRGHALQPRSRQKAQVGVVERV